MRELFNNRKIFGKVFIYDGMDYMKVVTNEVRQLHDILSMFGIKAQSEVPMDLA